MSILKDLPNLVKADIITEETADDIKNYYKNKGSSSTNRLFVVFGILGAILVGLGVILIIAHNWDELSKNTKTFFAFLPLVAAQIICGYVLIKKQDSVAWRESGSTLLFFGVGACISLVSQIYNISGDLSSFLLTWMLICLPIAYIMRSSVASLLFLMGITYYACETSYWSYPSSESYLYWLLLLAILPFYYLLYKKSPKSNFMVFHNWLVPLSLTIVLGTLANTAEELMFIGYFSLFGLFYIIGNLDFFSQQKTRNNGYTTIGSLGSLILLFILSFDGFWEDLRRKDFLFSEMLSTPEFLVSAIISILAGVLLYFYKRNRSWSDIKPLAPMFILFIVAFFIGLSLPIAVVLINFYVFALGLLSIREGAKQNHLGLLNYGLIIITILIACRFFDTDLSFVTRGILFVAIGIGFFASNYWMLKKRKVNEE
ncbi:hypothetical protein DKG77_05785 [Flagellimonas aquimarina]|uniref:DUF2157 domain-containing protein n=1 Tax=Flagellimonas aquimarina TaxID=2201895 RepID=A0A316LJN1_9FLAO|nr:DUF2157 domain-containing protein [Allomuricauda koreensis]PWL40330.1 hypothetical protein DKG77_05785 [Allomuricauda koreensis]